MLLSIVALGGLLVTRVKSVRLLIGMCVEFLSKDNIIGCWMISKTIKYYNFCTELYLCRKYQGKTNPINLKLGWNRIKLTSIKCDLSCLTLLLFSIGWDIMGYETEPLPSYRELRNWSHTIKFKVQFDPVYSSSRPVSWSHHLISWLDPGICSFPVHIS